ncbi:hypothetical protein [Rhodopila sp.]|jgi:caa(3)-type oxidase subunit IV|uniref:hypothetical protein n=1 Tax=Rhodopila sp. TaxID=2480087 RepID=UPI002BA9FC6C|nr:hypothetical protein [Rhodopila sp.]HVZ10301.1 hypothetical protein [Rhodopila sp.]
MWRAATTLLGLLSLFTAEVVIAVVFRMGLWALLPGIGMAGLVAARFMGLDRRENLPRIFALSGVFWLAILIGLTATDVLTRHMVIAH